MHVCSLSSLVCCTFSMLVVWNSWSVGGSHTFHLWIFRFERRWRVQRSAISIVNCRIPWADENFSVYYGLGIFLRTCVFQWLYRIASINITADKILHSIGFANPYMLPFPCECYVRHILDIAIVFRSAYKFLSRWSWSYLRPCGYLHRGLSVRLWSAKQCHEVGFANSLNLSI